MKIATLTAGNGLTSKTIETGAKELIFIITGATSLVDGTTYTNARGMFQGLLANKQINYRMQGAHGNIDLCLNMPLWDIFEINASMDDDALTIKKVGTNYVLKGKVSLSHDGALMASKQNALIVDLDTIPTGLSCDVNTLESPIAAKSVIKYAQQTILDSEAAINVEHYYGVAIKKASFTNISFSYLNGVECRFTENEVQHICENVNTNCINENGIVVSGYESLYYLGIHDARVLKVTPSGTSTTYYLFSEVAISVEHPSHLRYAEHVANLRKRGIFHHFSH
jgi:hypothetical protein